MVKPRKGRSTTMTIQSDARLTTVSTGQSHSHNHSHNHKYEYNFLDQAHAQLDFTSGKMSRDIWKAKYSWNGEDTVHDAVNRIADAVYAKDLAEFGATAELSLEWIKQYMHAGLWMPSGRILAGAGTDKLVTLLNCYVNGIVQDDMRSIMDHVSFAVLTMQQGGGVGTSFETIRPAGARLKRTGAGSRASGPLPFMDMWNTAGITVESAGARRGAQMGTISDTHPDMPDFVVAKRTPGRLTNFNVSVLVSDAFMEAIADDQEWLLYFNVEPIVRVQDCVDEDFIDDDGTKQYVYSIWKARDLWKLITENTYEYSEPGVIFIDRVNELNNLWYCEDIRCTNPCGEQPLPPHNACDLGHANLARMVRRPFTEDAYFDYDLLANVVTHGTRFLDNVLDVTNFPLEQQRIEVLNKRRIGLGYTGLADALAQLRARYGSPKSVTIADRIMQTIAKTAYQASIELAKEKGSFPSYDQDKFINDEALSFVNIRMPDAIKRDIISYGIRNGVLLTLAPCGTSSIPYGNPMGGLEPFFALKTRRKVLQSDKSHVSYDEYPYAVTLWHRLFPDMGNDVNNEWDMASLPSYFVTAKDLNIHDHLAIQAATQRWVDASISKTVNIPTEMEYEDFIQVYQIAYTSGCKGCTTYRPSDVRGSVLEDASASKSQPAQGETIAKVILRDRPEVLNGTTYRIKWPRRSAALYLTINSDEEGIPFELFLTSKDGTSSEWTTALSLMITAIFRKGGDFAFIADELKQIQSTNDGAFIKFPGEEKAKYIPSLPACIGHFIEKHLYLDNSDYNEGQLNAVVSLGVPSEMFSSSQISQQLVVDSVGKQCPECHEYSIHMEQGCEVCSSCGYSKCG